MERSFRVLPASDRPLRLKRRPDLESTPQQFGAARYRLVKDPVALRFFHLKEEEFAILSLLDGTATLRSIQSEYQRRFPPQQISLESIKSFIAELYRNGLLVSEAPGQGSELLKRARAQRRRDLATQLMNLLAIRFRGVDPRPLLRRLQPIADRLFTPACLLLVLLLALSAATLCAVQFEVFVSRLPALRRFFGGPNLIALMLCLASVKVLHELGHAAACRKFGGECHEIGLMLLAFIPCLYCDVTDAWRFRSRWRRMAVSAAGVYVEVLIAALCTFLWWFSRPGLFNSLCLNLVVVCSVSTVLLNGNPLLRYDGYYLLADLTETPNLWQRSRALLRGLLGRCCLGLDGPSERRLPAGRRGPLLLYGIASMAYRAVVVVLILWFVYRVLALHGLESLGRVLVVITLGGLLLPPMVVAVKALGDPVRRRAMNGRRLALTLILLALVVAGVLSIPFPYHVSAEAMVRLSDAHPVFVVEPGELQFAVAAGTPVKRGQPLAVLADPAMDREIRRMKGARDEQRQRVRTLELRRGDDPAAAGELPAARAALEDLERRLQDLRRDAGDLTLRAPIDGVIYPVPEALRPKREADLVESWRGSPLDPQNRGAYFKEGVFCLVGVPGRFEAVAVVDEHDVESVRVGQAVTLRIESLPGRTITGTVIDISRGNLQDDPYGLLVGGALPRSDDPDRADSRDGRSYTVRVELDGRHAALLHGARGSARIRAGSRSLGRRLLSFLRRTFTLNPARATRGAESH